METSRLSYMLINYNYIQITIEKKTKRNKIQDLSHTLIVYNVTVTVKCRKIKFKTKKYSLRHSKKLT